MTGCVRELYEVVNWEEWRWNSRSNTMMAITMAAMSPPDAVTIGAIIAAPSSVSQYFPVQPSKHWQKKPVVGCGTQIPLVHCWMEQSRMGRHSAGGATIVWFTGHLGGGGTTGYHKEVLRCLKQLTGDWYIQNHRKNKKISMLTTYVYSETQNTE